MDRIRAVIRVDDILVRNFHPELSRLNWSGYKESSYPGMALMRVLNDSGNLNDFQAQWLSPKRPEIEYHDLNGDPQGISFFCGNTPRKDKRIANF